MIKHTIFALFIGLAIFIAYLAQYLGAFRSVHVGIENREPMQMAAKAHFGEYHKVVANIQEVETWFNDNKLNCKLSFGEYLDDPKQVEQGRLRSFGGCILQAADIATLETWKPQMPAGFEIKQIHAQRYIVASFDGSPGIGPMKVYPKVYDFAQENLLKIKGPVMEIYEVFSKKEMHTTYLFAIE